MTESNGNFSFSTSKLPKMAPTTCVWRIFWTAGEKLHLTLSSVYFRFNCKRAYLEIRDGKHQNSRLYGRYCKGKNPPKEITSTNSSLWIKFHYGYRYFYNKRRPVGFRAEYKSKSLQYFAVLHISTTTLLCTMQMYVSLILAKKSRLKVLFGCIKGDKHRTKA